MISVASRLAATTLRVLPRKRLSRLIGQVMAVRAPATVLARAVGAFSRIYQVDMSETEIPSGGFTTFDAFFTRALKPGSRPIDPDWRAVVSPADGKIEASGEIVSEGCRLSVKGQSYTVQDLLADPAGAGQFAGGFYAVVYLSPRDYHRVHAPVTGKVLSVRHVPGTLFPVNSIGEHVPQLFARNERVAVIQENPPHGVVATILVGAMGVGRISLSFEHVPGSVLQAGDEIGVFHLGSTVVVLGSARQAFELTAHAGAATRMGTTLGRYRS